MKHSRSRHSEITRDRLDYSRAEPRDVLRRARTAEQISAIFNENKRTPSTTNIRTGRPALS